MHIHTRANPFFVQERRELFGLGGAEVECEAHAGVGPGGLVLGQEVDPVIAGDELFQHRQVRVRAGDRALPFISS